MAGNKKNLLSDLRKLTESFDLDEFDELDDEDEIPSVGDAIKSNPDGEEDEFGDDQDGEDIFGDKGMDDTDNQSIDMLKDAFETAPDDVKDALVSMMKLVVDNNIDMETLEKFLDEVDIEVEDEFDDEVPTDDEDNFDDDDYGDDEFPSDDEEDDEHESYDEYEEYDESSEYEYDESDEFGDDEFGYDTFESADDQEGDAQEEEEYEESDEEDEFMGEGYSSYSMSGGHMDLGDDVFGEAAMSEDSEGI